jgi:hypothetical protein
MLLPKPQAGNHSDSLWRLFDGGLQEDPPGDPGELPKPPHMCDSPCMTNHASSCKTAQTGGTGLACSTAPCGTQQPRVVRMHTQLSSQLSA